ncbi:presqualene diphosphate synthase HpnD [Salinifilum aidingensis]
MTPTDPLRAAYDECERITRQQARNFSYGIRLLPGPKRRALSAVYAFARRIDDIGDGALSVEEKLRQLKQTRAQLRELTTGADDPVLAALADTGERMPVPLEAFHELLDGCEADVRGRPYTTYDELLDYCRSVAGSIGRLSLGVFGTDDVARDAPRADALGIALQLTNILRDVREDCAAGRVYLPDEDLAAFGVVLHPAAAEDSAPPGGPRPGGAAGRDGAPLSGVENAGWDALMRYEIARTESWYDEGLQLLPALDRGSRACCAAMAGIYHHVLRRIAERPRTVLTRRTTLPTWRKAEVAARSLVGMRP